LPGNLQELIKQNSTESMYLDAEGNPVGESSLIPGQTMAFDISRFRRGGSALDVMNEAEAENAALKATLPEGLEGPAMPQELLGKTIAELKAMGAEEIATVDTRSGLSSTKWSGMDVQMSPDSEESYRKALQELDEESNDP